MKDLHLQNLMAFYQHALPIVDKEAQHILPEGRQKLAIISAAQAYRDKLLASDDREFRVAGLKSCQAFMLAAKEVLK